MTLANFHRVFLVRSEFLPPECQRLRNNNPFQMYHYMSLRHQLLFYRSAKQKHPLKLAKNEHRHRRKGGLKTWLRYQPITD